MPINFRRLLASFGFSLILVITVVEFVSFSKSVGSLSSIKHSGIEIATQESRESPQTDMSTHAAYIACMQENLMSDCNQPIDTIGKLDIAPSTDHEMLSAFTDSNLAILVIYLLLTLTLTNIIYIHRIPKAVSLSEGHYYAIEFSTNAGPALGLMGTFYSIASILNGNNASVVANTLLNSFFDAILTTFVGLVVYLIGNYLKAVIYPRINL